MGGGGGQVHLRKYSFDGWVENWSGNLFCSKFPKHVYIMNKKHVYNIHTKTTPCLAVGYKDDLHDLLSQRNFL